MPVLIPPNAASGTIADNPLADDATVINLDTGQGVWFSEPAAGEVAYAKIVDAAETPGVGEIITFEGRIGDQLTGVTRGVDVEESPFDVSLEWPQGSKIGEVLTRGSLDDIIDDRVPVGLVGVTADQTDVWIPGLRGSPDKGTFGASDDEFDVGNSPPPGWTAIGSPTVSESENIVASHYVLKTGAGSGFIARGIQKDAPSLPFTFTVKMSDLAIGAGSTNNRIGIAVLDAGVANMSALMVENVGGGFFSLEAFTCTPSAYGSNIATFTAGIMRPPLYLRIEAVSSDDVAFWMSLGGHVWTLLAASHNPSYTVAKVAIFGSPDNASQGPQATFDWARFT